jgi:zinc/manganese transport system permease protein
VVLALSTALTVPVVGALLTFSLMIGPPAAARLLSRRPSRAIALSITLALVTVWLSIAGSYTFNLPIGFFVGTLGAVLFLGARLWGVLRSRRQRLVIA